MKKEIDKLAWLYIRDGKLLTVRSKSKELFYIPALLLLALIIMLQRARHSRIEETQPQAA